MAENFPHLKKETDIQIQKAQRVPNKIYSNRPTPRHIIIKILKELRKAIDRNADYCKKELETIRRSQEKLENSFEERKAELKTMNSRMNETEEQISDLEDGIMEIT